MALITIVLQDEEDAVHVQAFFEPDFPENPEEATVAQAYAVAAMGAIISAAGEDAPEIEPPDPED